MLTYNNDVNEDDKLQTGDFCSEWGCYFVETQTYSENLALSASPIARPSDYFFEYSTTELRLV